MVFFDQDFWLVRQIDEFVELRIQVSPRTTTTTIKTALRISGPPFYPGGASIIGAKVFLHLINVNHGHDPSIRFVDLQGCKYRSDTNHRGIGTTLVNTSIAFLQHHYDINLRCSGNLTPVDDPLDPQDRSAAHAIRVQFWRKAGFEVIEPYNPVSAIRASVRDLVIRRDGLLLGRYPRFYALETFVREIPRKGHLLD